MVGDKTLSSLDVTAFRDHIREGLDF
jgi:hypothetical protein